MQGLAAAAHRSAPDLDAAVGAVLDRRLARGQAKPIAVAFSGGGDSLALLLAADVWARRAGRELVVLTVDHRLRPESAAWTAACAAVAARLGRPFEALAWTGDKPATGLPAAARAARHALLADAARYAGARVILIGHTADDVLEARRMRAAGSTTPEPGEWSPSPAWPQGRGLFLLRPLLACVRSDIRDWLAARGETWIEDPANADLSFARARARHLAGTLPAPPEPASPAPLARACRAGSGGLAIARATLRDAAPEAVRRFVSAACVCAAGTRRPPPAARVGRLVEALTSPGVLTATLAGARIEAGEHDIRFLREAGEAARGGLAPLSLSAGETGVWDGRFEIATERPVEVRRLAGLAHKLDPADQAALRALPANARPSLPLIVDEDGRFARPVLGPVVGVRVTSLAHDRLLAACGAIEREPA